MTQISDKQLIWLASTAGALSLMAWSAYFLQGGGAKSRRELLAGSERWFKTALRGLKRVDVKALPQLAAAVGEVLPWRDKINPGEAAAIVADVERHWRNIRPKTAARKNVARGEARRAGTRTG